MNFERYFSREECSNAYALMTACEIQAKRNCKFPSFQRLQRQLKRGKLSPEVLAYSIACRVSTWTDLSPEYQTQDQNVDTVFVRNVLGIADRIETKVDGAYPNIPMPPRFVLALAELIHHLRIKSVHDWGCGEQTDILLGALCPHTHISGNDIDVHSICTTISTVLDLGLTNVVPRYENFFEADIPEAELHIVHTPLTFDQDRSDELLKKIEQLPVGTLVVTLFDFTMWMSKSREFEMKPVTNNEIFLYSQFYAPDDIVVNQKLALFEKISD